MMKSSRFRRTDSLNQNAGVSYSAARGRHCASVDKKRFSDKFMLILASSSPRRAELLSAAGIDFTVRAADVDETIGPNEPPRDYVVRLSREKARAVVRGDELALGADTTVVINGEIIGKPVDVEEAGRMLRALSGQWHEVLTGVTLARADRVISAVSSTRVKFAELSDAEIKWYVSTGEPMDKAGAYAIQGHASLFVERIEGSYSNVVGLPVQLTYQLARRMGVNLLRIADCGLAINKACLHRSNPQSAIRNPQSAIRNPQSAIRNPQSAIRRYHSTAAGGPSSPSSRPGIGMRAHSA